MDNEKEQLFNVSSIGALRQKSLAMLAHHLEDPLGNELQLDDLQIDQGFFVVFASGTGLTRTSAVRVA